MSPKTRISSLTGTVSERLNAALKLPNGARFYPCALQINPFGYLSRHGKHANFRNEVEYNAAIIGACQELEIEVIGVTDHYRVKDSAGIVQAARDAGLFVFSGFEGVAKDGVHLLCLFDADKDPVLERLDKQEEVLKTEASNSAIANALSRSGSQTHIEFLHLLTEDLVVPCFQPPEARIVVPAFC